jgi:hypothetical protein
MAALQGRLRLDWRLTTVLAMAGAVLASTGVVVAAGGLPGPNGQIQGCYNNATGVLRVVGDASQCLTAGQPAVVKSPLLRETPLAWNQTGPTGPQGAQGPQGQQGPAGPAGTGLASLDDLNGKPCNAGAGTLHISYGVGGAVSMTCAQQPSAPTSFTLLVTLVNQVLNPLAPLPSGSLTSSASVLGPGTTCTTTAGFVGTQRCANVVYAPGESVSLVASLSSGTSITWSGDCSGTSTTCLLSMIRPMNVTVTFA